MDNETMENEIKDTFLSDDEKVQVERFLSNKVMIQAVKKVILYPMYNQGTLTPGEEANPALNFCLTLGNQMGVPTERLGEDIKAIAEGVRFVITGFENLEKFKEVEEKPKDTTNKAR